MPCHHIDWDNLQIKVSTPHGQNEPIYTCILCNREISPEEYKETLKNIAEKKKENTLKFYRTPKGSTHSKEECPDERKCPIHGDEQND